MNKSNNKGFTLAELLVVVAVIGVLVAISIPIFSNQMKKVRLATNQANARAAYAAAIVAYIENPDVTPFQDNKSQIISYVYDISTGIAIHVTQGADAQSKGWDVNKYTPNYFVTTKSTSTIPIGDWDIETQGLVGRSYLSRDVYHIWKIDIYGGTSDKAGQIYDVCWLSEKNQ